MDVITLRIDQQCFRRCVTDLAAENESGLVRPSRRIPKGLLFLHLSTDHGNIIRRLVQGQYAEQIGGGGLLQIGIEPLENCLGGCQIAGGKKHQHAVARPDEGVHLGVGGHIVETRVGPRVRTKDQPLIGVDGKAIGHESFEGRMVIALTRMPDVPDSGRRGNIGLPARH